MLAIVDNKQSMPAFEPVKELFTGGGARLRSETHGSGDHMVERFRLLHRSQLNKPGALRKAPNNALRDVEREPGLTHATRPDQRHETSVGQHGSHLVLFLFAADKPAELGGQATEGDVERP